MVIRRHPGDFVVREVLTAEASREIRELPGPRARYAVYRVERESMTTPDAAKRLAGLLGAKPGGLSWAGLKDKHARTMQHMTVPVVGGPMSMARRVEVEGFAGELIGWSELEADASWIRANAFAIVVRGMSAERSAAMLDVVRARCDDRGGAGLAFVNYFGLQRFASARHGQGFAARALVAGDFERAMRLLIGTPTRKETGTRRVASRLLASKWGMWAELASELRAGAERRAAEVLARGGGFRESFESLPHFTKQMCVEAYQSWLWNRIAGGVVGIDAGNTLVPPQPETIEAAVRSVSIAMPGPGASFEGDAGGAAARVMEAEGVTLDGLRVPGVRRPVFGTPTRPLVVRGEDVAVQGPERDECGGASDSKVMLSFLLPRGAYATVLLAAIEQWATGRGIRPRA